MLSHASDDPSVLDEVGVEKNGHLEKPLAQVSESVATVPAQPEETVSGQGTVPSKTEKKVAESSVLRSDDPVSSKWPMVLLSLVLILALIFALGWVTRRMGGFRAMGKEMIVLATMPMGSRERLALIEVSGQKLLLGITSQQITLLHTFDSNGQDVCSGDDQNASSSESDSSNEFMETLKAAVSRQIT